MKDRHENFILMSKTTDTYFYNSISFWFTEYLVITRRRAVYKFDQLDEPSSFNIPFQLHSGNIGYAYREAKLDDILLFLMHFKIRKIMKSHFGTKIGLKK